jgi:hypothetical protein
MLTRGTAATILTWALDALVGADARPRALLALAPAAGYDCTSAIHRIPCTCSSRARECVDRIRENKISAELRALRAESQKGSALKTAMEHRRDDPTRGGI